MQRFALLLAVPFVTSCILFSSVFASGEEDLNTEIVTTIKSKEVTKLVSDDDNKTKKMEMGEYPTVKGIQVEDIPLILLQLKFEKNELLRKQNELLEAQNKHLETIAKNSSLKLFLKVEELKAKKESLEELTKEEPMSEEVRLSCYI